MQLVVCDPENIPAWLYPSVLPNYPDPGISATIPELGKTDFAALWKALGFDLPIEEALVYEDSRCDVGFPHDAPDCVLRIPQEFVTSLNSIAPHERWRFAEKWAEFRYGQRPNKEQREESKKLLNIICDQAAHAAAQKHAMVLISSE